MPPKQSIPIYLFLDASCSQWLRRADTWPARGGVDLPSLSESWSVTIGKILGKETVGPESTLLSMATVCDCLHSSRVGRISRKSGLSWNKHKTNIKLECAESHGNQASPKTNIKLEWTESHRNQASPKTNIKLEWTESHGNQASPETNIKLAWAESHGNQESPEKT